MEKQQDEEESQFFLPSESPPKQISKSLMMRNEENLSNLLTRFLKDYSHEILQKYMFFMDQR